MKLCKTTIITCSHQALTTCCYVSFVTVVWKKFSLTFSLPCGLACYKTASTNMLMLKQIVFTILAFLVYLSAVQIKNVDVMMTLK